MPRGTGVRSRSQTSGPASPLEPLESQSSPSLRVACVRLPHSRGQPRHRACVSWDGAACSALDRTQRVRADTLPSPCSSSRGLLRKRRWPRPRSAADPGSHAPTSGPSLRYRVPTGTGSTYTCTSPPGSRDRDAVGSVWSLSPIFPPCCLPPGLLMPVWPVPRRRSRVALPPLGADSQHAGDSQRHRYLRLRLSTKNCADGHRDDAP